MNRWLRELALGARMARAGARSTWTRTLMTALGVGLGVALMLFASAVPGMVSARDQRIAARDDVQISHPARDRATMVLVGQADTRFHDSAIRGRLLQPLGPRPTLPPGLQRMPRAGELVVSPALARLLDDGDDGALLRQRFPYRVVGQIADAGLEGPGEYAYYAGSDRLRGKTAATGVQRVDRFGSAGTAPGLDPVIAVLAVIVFVALLVPVAIFVATAARFGGEARNRRLAALRLIGADARMVRRVAAGEALVGALLGLAVGLLTFLLARQLIGHLTLWRLSAFPRDVRPNALLALLIAIAVPGLTIAVTLATLRGVTIEPLGVTRQAQPIRRRLWWRLAPSVGGVLLLLRLLGGGITRGNELAVAAGVILLLSGVAVLLPWLIEAIVWRIGVGGGLAWQLAARRLQHDSGTAARVVCGIAVAAAGAIALQTLFSGVQPSYTHVNRGGEPAAVQTWLPLAATSPRAAAAAARLRAVPGVDSVVVERATRSDSTVSIRLDPAQPDAIERLRNAAAAIDPQLAISQLSETTVASQFANLRRGLFVGAVAVLLLIGASMLVGALEQLQERRRLIAALVAFGTPRATLARSLLWQAAVPVALGLALAVVTGAGLGALLLGAFGEPVSLDVGAIAGMTAVGAAVVLLVTALSLPALRRLARPEGLRTE